MSELKTLYQLLMENPKAKFRYVTWSGEEHIYFDDVSGMFHSESNTIYLPVNPECSKWEIYEEPKITPIGDEWEELIKENEALKEKLNGALIRRRWPDEKPIESGYYFINSTDQPRNSLRAYYFRVENHWSVLEIEIADQDFYFYEPYAEEL